MIWKTNYILIYLSINICIVFLSILTYSMYYMFNDLHILKFIIILFWFVSSMLFFILSNEILTTFIGWELIGLLSFFLISYFWFRIIATKYAYKAFYIGKIGDILLLMFITINIKFYGCLIFISLFDLQSDFLIITYILPFLLIAAFTKSTQFFLHVWLPEAMEGPIPVSSLIHAATLVISGIVLIYNYIELINNYYINIYIYVLWTNIILLNTIFICLNNYDLKKFIAFSTIMQISICTFTCIFIDENLAIMLSFYHMLYKSILFLTAGIIVHMQYSTQDMRLYQLNNYTNNNILNILFIHALYNSCSLWFITGFYIKDIVIDSLCIMEIKYSIELLICIIIFFFFTFFYNMTLIAINYIKTKASYENYNILIITNNESIIIIIINGILFPFISLYTYNDLCNLNIYNKEINYLSWDNIYTFTLNLIKIQISIFFVSTLLTYNIIKIGINNDLNNTIWKIYYIILYKFIFNFSYINFYFVKGLYNIIFIYNFNLYLRNNIKQINIISILYFLL